MLQPSAQDTSVKLQGKAGIQENHGDCCTLILNDIIFDMDTKKNVPVDLDEIIKSRMLLQANSGGGKSHIIRKFAEKSHGKVQQIIIDPEGEFHTLREKYEYLLVAKGNQADIQIDSRHAPLLARKLMETEADAILDLYELNPFERIRFVKIFLESLVNLPKNLWHPCLIVIDEIHTFAPESKSGRSESLSSVAALASRGRKRGYAIIGATQRISKLSKDIAAELNTKLIGRCSLDGDRKRAADELRIKESIILRKLKHEFYAFGPAISNDNILVKAHKTDTTHEEIGNIKQYIPANKSKINSLMKNFAELPQEAEIDLKTKEGLQLRIRELQAKIRQTEKSQQPKQNDPQIIEKAYQRGLRDGERESKEIINTQEKYIQSIKRSASKIKQSIANLQSNTDHDFALILQTGPNIPEKLPRPEMMGRTPIEKDAQASVNLDHGRLQTITASPTNNNSLGRCETQILIALKQKGTPLTKFQIAVIAGYSFKAGGFNNAISKLKTNGLIESQENQLVLTELGHLEVQEENTIPPTHEDILQFWTQKLGKCPASILRLVCQGGDFTKDYIAQMTNYSATAGGFNNGLSKLKSLGLITKESNGNYKAAEELFP